MRCALDVIQMRCDARRGRMGNKPVALYEMIEKFLPGGTALGAPLNVSGVSGMFLRRCVRRKQVLRSD